ncbi:hypothetical protein GWI33_006142 [Rhynchophorus ferrugineus]|uniref:Uncharacterized protein n=1 Tax=Rhynchophorus ferrugineus TaxID=354439 RepID=A0A834IGG7_RHYFE|nr:hypothetical protein GWI33_006142 [Rhynchophorus ferrugineus]
MSQVCINNIKKITIPKSLRFQSVAYLIGKRLFFIRIDSIARPRTKKISAGSGNKVGTSGPQKEKDKQATLGARHSPPIITGHCVPPRATATVGQSRPNT